MAITQLFFELLQYVVFTKVALNEMDVVNWFHFQQIKRNHHATITHALGGNLRPATRCGTEVDNNLATLEQLVLVVDLK